MSDEMDDKAATEREIQRFARFGLAYGRDFQDLAELDAVMSELSMHLEKRRCGAPGPNLQNVPVRSGVSRIDQESFAAKWCQSPSAFYTKPEGFGDD